MKLPSSMYLIPVVVFTFVCAAATYLGPVYDLSWHTIDGGGGTSNGGSFNLTATIGQPDAGAVMIGGPFALTGGFWAGVGSAPGAPCPWDLDGSGSVGAADLLDLLFNWGPCPGCAADFDGDDIVGASDLLAMLFNWGPCP